MENPIKLLKNVESVPSFSSIKNLNQITGIGVDDAVDLFKNKSKGVSEKYTDKANNLLKSLNLPTKEIISLKNNLSDMKAQLANGLRALSSTYYQVPLTLRLSSEKNTAGFTLPIDPLLSISCKNIITRRYVSKSDMRGSIKESWSQDDYEITIAGILMGFDDEYGTTNVDDYIREMIRYCEAKESVGVVCDLLNNVFDITHISIQSYDFPFTKGLNNQAFQIKCCSDDSHSLII